MTSLQEILGQITRYAVMTFRDISLPIDDLNPYISSYPHISRLRRGQIEITVKVWISITVPLRVACSVELVSSKLVTEGLPVI
jgi:hypothetical protein